MKSFFSALASCHCNYSLLLSHPCLFHREKEKVEATVARGPQRAPGQQQATGSLCKEHNIRTMIHVENLKVGTSTGPAGCWLHQAHLPKRLHLRAVFTEAFLQMALHRTGPKAPYGQDVGSVRLEEEAESVACMAGSGVGQTEAARGQESGAGAVCRQQASSQER